jgi:carboxyl-terminal processing protease
MVATPDMQSPTREALPLTQVSPARAEADRRVSRAAISAFLVVLAFGAGWFGNGFVNNANYIPADDVNQQVLNQAYDQITKNFVFTNNIDKQKMTYAAINAMVGTLNDTGHTRFETPEQHQAENNSLQNQKNVGVGIYLSGGGDQPITITGVIPGSPAAAADVIAGDQIVGINGTSAKGLTVDQARPLIRGDGQEGTPVTLTLFRPGAPAPGTHDVHLNLAAFVAPTVLSFMIPELNMMDIQLLDFSANADDQIREALTAAKKANVKGIILDLRGNGGGYLDQAVKVTSEFVPAGANANVMILHTRTATVPYAVASGGLATTTPLVILIDANTASAAEITAGAIAINRKVPTVGQTTFGTGTVLEPRALADGSTLVLGTAEWRLPDDESVYHRGYDPRYPVALPTGVKPFTQLSLKTGIDVTQAQIQQANDAQLLKAIDVLQQEINGTYQP